MHHRSSLKHIYLKHILSFCLILSFQGGVIFGQNPDPLVAYLPFDNMDAGDKADQGTSVAINGTPEYGCGVVGGAILLDGDDFLLLNGRANNSFSSIDFTLSFYFKPTNFSRAQDIISKRQACTTQRAFAIRFLPSSNSIEVILAENTTKETNFIVPLPRGRCWYHLAVVKAGRTTIIYINGEEVVKANTVAARIDLDNPESLTIANGPCRGITDERFEGYLDELRVFDEALDRASIRSLYTEPDAVGNADTLLFLGGTVPLRIDNTCASAIRWNPSTNIDDPTSSSAIYTPSAEGTFKIWATFDDGTCVASDTIKIVVIDPANLDCGQIFIPNAFTPNGDGINDVLGVDNPFAMEKMNSFEIIDRLGNTLFVTNDVFVQWDGMYKSKVVSPGIYIYRILFECKGESLGRTGSFTVLK